MRKADARQKLFGFAVGDLVQARNKPRLWRVNGLWPGRGCISVVAVGRTRKPTVSPYVNLGYWHEYRELTEHQLKLWTVV